MKKGVHPENYRLVAFKDMSNEDVFITKSTVETKETIVYEGVEYPVVKMEISRTSHPFYTGKSKLIDTAGRIDKLKTNMLNTLNNFCFIHTRKPFKILKGFFIFISLKTL
jgi:large subunit ribosomal protein L31